MSSTTAIAIDIGGTASTEKLFEGLGRPIHFVSDAGILGAAALAVRAGVEADR